jgi:transmembrane sensor
MTKQRLEYLLDRYLDSSLSAEEHEEWQSVLNDIELRDSLNELIDGSYYQLTDDELVGLSSNKADKIFTNISQQGAPQKKKTTRLWPRFAAAASILLLLSVAVYFYKQSGNQQQIAQMQFHDIAPGSNKATITLANGKQIALTGAKNGLLASQGNTTINMNGNNVIYNASGSANELQYNTMTTPRGGQYPLTLSDGTKVWLDAESSITYPVAFIGNDRPVKVTGQVYFEVAHNPAKPFRVTADNQTVEVLGTHFNVNAYPDEPGIKTTLLEGSVKIMVNGAKAVLKPGQQAQTNQDKITVLSNVDMSEAIAWHNGLFQFHKADIQTIMRQLARWYDVDVSYEGKIPDLTFSGKIYRNITALKVSDILSYEKIHFRIEGKKIIVTP